MQRLPKYTTIRVVLLTAFALFAMYSTAYAFTGHRVCGYRDPRSGQSYCGTSYDHSWEAKLFVPAAWLESVVRQQNIATGTVDEATWLSRSN